MTRVSQRSEATYWKLLSEEISQLVVNTSFFALVAGEAVDPMRYLLIVKQGEVHVIKTFRVPLKEKKVATTTRGWNERRADLCALGPSSAFLEQSMFSSYSQPQTEAKDSSLAAKKKKKQAAEVETRGSTLVTSCCCEIGWLSKHIFNQLINFGIKGMLGGTGGEGGVQSNGFEMMTSLKEWMLVYPSEAELKRLYYDNKVSESCNALTMCCASWLRLSRRSAAKTRSVVRSCGRSSRRMSSRTLRLLPRQRGLTGW